MMREISAGGVVVRKRKDVLWMAAIELPALPDRVASNPPSRVHKKSRPVLALPKGLVDLGEKPLETALREVREETGITASPICKLADIKYVYVRTWAGGERVFKIVSFYLLKYESGRIDDIADEMRVEVARARWIPLEDSPGLLAYKGEKDVARKAMEYLKTNGWAI